MMRSSLILKDEFFISYQIDLAKILGRGGAIFLQKLYYWMKSDSGITHKDKKWIFNTFEEWADQIGYSVRQTKRIISHLNDLGIIWIEKLSPKKSDRTNYYTVNRERLDELLREKLSEEKYSNFQDEKAQSKGKNGTMYISKNTDIDTENNKSMDPLKNSEDKLSRDFLPKDQFPQGPQEGLSLKRTTAQDMLDCWNKLLPKAKAQMNKDLAKKLVAALKYKFDLDLSKWEKYCLKIKSSDYLMGDSFTLSLYWGLKFSTIDRLERGEFGVKDIPVNSAQTICEIENEINLLKEEEACKEVRRKLLKIYGPEKYCSWIKKLFFHVKGESVYFRAPSKFVEDYIKRNFQELGWF